MKQISSKELKEIILAEAETIKRKRELFEQVKKISLEVKQLNESAPPMVGSFGFQSQGDVHQKTKDGFVKDPNAPKMHVSRTLQELEEEMTNLEEREVMEEENAVENIKKQNEELKRKLDTIEKTLATFSQMFKK